MRVVAGTARGTQLLSVPGDTTRPILDRVKTALFDILRPELEGTRWLDVFSGTGQVGIEALSQGAKNCIFLDLEEKAVKTIKANLDKTHFPYASAQDPAQVRHTDAFTFLRNTVKEFDFIFVAPPQYLSLWVQAMHIIAERPQLLSPQGKIVVQIDPSEYEALQLSEFEEKTSKTYGKSMLLFYTKR